MCGTEPFKAQFLPKPTQVIQNGDEYIGFSMDKGGKLLELDCELQKAQKKLSLYAEEVSTIESQLNDTNKNLQLYADKYQTQLTEITTLETNLSKVTTRAETCEMKVSDTPWWKMTGYILLGFIVGGGLGVGAGAIATH